MASRHEIVSIDFRANAAKANPAMDALRESAKHMRTEIEKTKTAIADGIKTGKSQEELDKLGSTLKTQERQLHSFENAMNTLVKGVGTLSRAIDAFNSGTLQDMSAAFQKASYNAAETAKKALLPGSKDYQKNMAELDALQQKNLENLAKYKLRTEQMLKSIGEGGKISSQDLKQEADGIQELMRLLPHMGNEWTEYYHILTRVNDAIKQQADNEQRLKGSIVDVNDARERSSQLTRQGVEGAARQRKEAEAEVEQRNKNIAALKAERDEKAKQVSIDAASAIAKDKEVEKQRRMVAGIKESIANEEKDAERKQKKIDKLNKEAATLENTAKTEREAVETIKAEVGELDKELKQVNEDLAKLGGATPAATTNPVLEGVKQGADEAKASIEEVMAFLHKFNTQDLHEFTGGTSATTAERRAALRLNGFTGLVDLDEQAAGYWGTSIPLDKKIRNQIVEDAALKHFGRAEEWGVNTNDTRVDFLTKSGKLVDFDYLRELTEEEQKKVAKMSASQLRNFVEELIKEQYGEILAVLKSDEFDSYHYTKGKEGMEALKKVANVEVWENGVPKGVKETQEEVAAKNQLIETTKQYIREEQQSTTVTTQQTKATEENTAAKEKEAKASEESAKAAEGEKVTVESLIKKNDELKVKLAELNKEREQIIAKQKEGAAATKEEANAYKGLTKEQAQAMLDQKRQLATFKNEGGKWQITNRQEAQRYLFDALGEINPNNLGKTTMSIESSPEKISQLLGKFQERYGIEGESEAMAAVRELMSSGGMVKNGFMNKFFMNVEQDVPKVAAFSKEIKDLTAVINGEVKAVEEVTEKTRTLEDVEADIAATEAQSKEISIQTMKLRNGQADATENLTQKTVKLTDAQKDRIATIKSETEAIRQMSQEEAKAALAETKKVSTVGYKGGKLHMSDPEEVQQFLIGKMRTIGKVRKDDGTLSLAGGQVDALVSAFQQRYGWKDDKTNAKALLKKILQGKDGMFMGGTADLSGDVGSVTIQYAKEMYDARIERAKALVDVSNGVKKATDEVSDATRRGADAAKDATEATKGQTDAIKAQEVEVARRKSAYDKVNEEYEQANKKLKGMRQRYASLPSSGTDGALAKAQLKDEIDDFNENVVKKTRADKNRLEKLWKKSVSDLTKMMGISTEETQKSTAAQNQEGEAVEKGAKSRGRKKKAVEDSTAAVKEEAKAEGDAAKQGEQLSEQDQKRIALEQKKQELETKRGQKIDEITKKEEHAAGLDVKVNNNRSEARQITEELAQAHGKNADALDKESEKLKKSEFEQGKLNDKVNEGRKALSELDEKIDENASKRLEAEKKQAQARRLTIDTMTEAVKVLESRNREIAPEGKEWQENTRLIRQYKEELDRLKQQPVLQLMTERMGSIRTLSADALQETKKFWQTMADGAERGSHQLEVYEGNLRVIAEEERQRQQLIQAPMRQRLNNLGGLSNADLAETKRYWEAVRDGADHASASYKKAELAVKALNNEENRRKAQSQAQHINDMMRDLNNISTSGLTEVKRYWQAMADGAKRGSDELRDAEQNLKRINEIESERRRTADKQQVRTLFGDLNKKNGEDIRAAIEAGRRLIDTYDSGGPAAKRLSQAILDAEEYLKQYGIEAERSARREAQALAEAAQRRKEQDQLMRQQLDQGTSLSESALKTQQQYWQRLIDDPKTAKESLAGYRYELERTIALQEQQASVTREERAARLNGNLSDYSTAEIKEAIEAAKQLVASYKSGSTEATELTQKIVTAEEHINKYSLETERAAKKQSDAIDEMRAQLDKGTTLTESALKAQESYWRRLADDPKATNEEIERYLKNMREAQHLQSDIAANRGADTLAKAQSGGFATANMTDLTQAIKDIKEYQSLIKDPNGAGKETFGAAKEQIEALTAQLDALKGKTDKVKATFEDADAVMKRFAEHMKGVVVTTPGQSIDEQLSQHVSFYDDDIKRAAENVDYYEQQIKEATDELERMEKKLATLEKKHQNSSWFRKQTKEYRHEAWRIEELRDDIYGHDVPMDDGTTFRTGKKQDIEDLKNFKQTHQGFLDFHKRHKAESLGLVEIEEQIQKARRMTREEMQEGIKILEAEAMAQDRSTADGQKRWEELRKTIGEMNRELKEATGEWMKLADAERVAQDAGTDRFAGYSVQDIQRATQALERQRDTIIATIREKRANKEATKAEEDQLADLTKKLRSLKFEQDNVNMSQEKMRTLIETPANAVNLDELRAAIKRADGQLRQMQQSLGQNSDEYKRFAEQVRQAKNVMKEMEGQAKASATAWEKAFNRLKTYVVMYMGFNEVWQKVSGTLGDLMQLSDRMGEVGKTTQMTAEQVGRLTDRLRDLDTRTSLVALTELSAKAGQLGLKTEEDILGFTEAANKMLVALPEMGADGATQMMKVALATGEVNRIKKDMDKGLIEGSSATAVAMEKIASTIDQLRANSAAAAPQITDFVKRVGAVGAQSGITIDQVAALGSTVDSLGMRVEMSATALSRMIPAIKNNAFEVAKAIGMAPEALRKMFDEAGGGMNAMLAIFQHIKDAGMNPDDIEKMLGMGGMQDIMKDLNQQGARAGIVFAGLSQNVDVLRQHLGIARDAYEENVAIQQEYDRMSETTAAKWERLKNKFEEMWVGTSANNALGGVIDALRVIVDLISGPLNTAFVATISSVVAIKSGLTSIPAAAGSVFDYLKESAQKAADEMAKAANATDAISDAAEGVEEAADVVGDIGDALSDAKEAGEQAGEAVELATGAISGMGAASKVSIFSINGLKTAWKGLDTTMKANIIVAVIALLYTLGKAIYDIVTSVDAEKKALAEANQEADRATEKLGVYFDHLKDTTAELDAARKATEGLTAGTDKATEAEIRMTKATDDHRTAIANINQNYSKYLGFMLTEYDRAEMVAAAHNKIAAAIRREILMRQKQASIEENEKKHQDDLSDDWAKIVSQMTEDDRMTGEQAASARLAFRKMLSKSYTTNANGDLVASDELKKSLGSLYNDHASLEQLTAVWMARHLQQNYGLSRDAIKDITGIDYYKSNYGTSRGKYVWNTSKEFMGNNLRGDYLEEYFDMQRENAKTGRLYQEDLGATEEDLKESTTTIVGQLKDNINAQISLLRQSNLSAKERNDAYAELARALEGVNENVDELETAEQQQTKQFVTDVLEKNKKFIDSSRLQRARDKIQQGFDAFSTLDTETNNIWGNRLPAESTDWKNMTAEQLVNRRKQMKDFVNAIQTDTDVKAVLEEDAALKKAIKKGMSSDMRTVIEWYNTERLKIQDELHARHLTNTGDWMDPKKQRSARKQWHDEIDAYLHELDAYYTERKTRIEQARNDEEITEGEAWRRIIQNDNEWQTRRGELQKIYADKSGEVTQEEMDAIYRIISERTGDTVEFVRGMVAKTNKFAKDIAKASEQGAATAHEWWSGMDVDAERSFLKAAQAIGKQMKFIEETLAKERPYDGITKNLQDNLDKMGVLAAKYRRENEELARQNKEPKYSNEQITAQSYDEMAFYLRQAADAYSIDIDELLHRMVKEGMTATAEEISKSDMLKQAVMGQLRKTYQEVQDDIKKEASQIKKDVEIIWNDDARGIGGMSMKATFDKALAQLGMQQDSVSRANSLIGAGAASDNVASRLAMKQIEVQMRMQKAQYDMYRVQANQRMAALRTEAEEHRRLAKQMEKENHLAESTRELLMATNAERDAENVRLSLGLTLAEETKKEEQQKAELLKIQEESQNRLYTSLREWANLLTSSLQGVMEASHAGDAEYYNERAKLDLTGKGGPGAGTYIIIDNEGTSDAEAHYEYLDEREALERQREIERQNAMAEAWRKLMDDINMKMSEQITDWINATLQNASVDANTAELVKNASALGINASSVNMNTDAIGSNTDALRTLTEQLAQGISVNIGGGSGMDTPPEIDESNPDTWPRAMRKRAGLPTYEPSHDYTQDAENASPVFSGPGEANGFVPVWEQAAEAAETSAERQVAASAKVEEALKQQFHKQVDTATDANKRTQISTQSAFAKMTQAMNLYGIAYQAMSNDNMSATQKFEMIAIQAAGQAAITSLTASGVKMVGDTAVQTPSVLSKIMAELGPIAGPIAFGAFTALLGGLMGLATSKLAKSKSQIAQVTGASVGAGRLATGMLTYAEGNVNELTDPASLTPGRQYNVDGADGKTYRARYMGKGAKTHITNGPEFHLVGEAGREAIIDAKTTRLLQMDETGIWHAIQTLYNGGSISGLSSRRRRGGVAAFADGNIGEFEDAIGGETPSTVAGGFSMEQMAAFQQSLDNNTAIMQRMLDEGIEAFVSPYGKQGIVNGYDTYKKEAQRHGEKYL